MSPTNEVDIIQSTEFFDNVLSESVAHTSVVRFPAQGSFLGIRPKYVAHNATVWDINRSRYFLNLAETCELSAKASVHQEYATFY
mmetsp:Transcript_33066/g.51699  ORF Transcript_33066/g.51699 Transcript_33066/m.51699 type:complete len:85 (-) Transcript_33066:464-718(-)